MSIIGVRECACADFEGLAMPESGPAVLRFRGQSGVRLALAALQYYANDGLRYHGGVHVDGVHVLGIVGDNGEVLYESVCRKQTRVLGRVHTEDELRAIGWVP